MSYDRLNEEITAYQLSLFRPSDYLRDEYKSQYEKRRVRNFTQAKRETFSHRYDESEFSQAPGEFGILIRYYDGSDG